MQYYGTREGIHVFGQGCLISPLSNGGSHVALAFLGKMIAADLLIAGDVYFGSEEAICYIRSNYGRGY